MYNNNNVNKGITQQSQTKEMDYMDKLIMESKAEHFDTFDIYAEAIDRRFRKSMDDLEEDFKYDTLIDSMIRELKAKSSQQNTTSNTK